MNDDLMRFNDLLDRHGAELDNWPRADEALWARRLLMSDPEARRHHAEALALHGMLAGHKASLDVLLDVQAATARISQNVMGRLPQRVAEVRWWAPRIAAGFLLAFMAGGVFDVYRADRQTADPVEVASLDALVFGPAELDLP